MVGNNDLSVEVKSQAQALEAVEVKLNSRMDGTEIILDDLQSQLSELIAASKKGETGKSPVQVEGSSNFAAFQIRYMAFMP